MVFFFIISRIIPYESISNLSTDFQHFLETQLGVRIVMINRYETEYVKKEKHQINRPLEIKHSTLFQMGSF